ncbi:hypothetical protein GIB67_024534 [Kingdonia uniflora]|uniref:Cystatin domain-containing protein n=1 Tax=Kingdonia uniflora TaxID=39325 RepID=A0A7J7LNU7_9MAGN|nr:hypothetical protein GIB67_024534 [Kingdonia uniflora]
MAKGGMILCMICLWYVVGVVGLVGGGKLGGRTIIKDVKNNKEVQDLGKFSVEEYNKEEGLGESSGALSFNEVVEAEKQVISGLEYYLKISAVKSGVLETFDAAVVVKASGTPPKKLLNFAPTTN